MSEIADRLRAHIQAGFTPQPQDAGPTDDTLQLALAEDRARTPGAGPGAGADCGAAAADRGA